MARQYKKKKTTAGRPAARSTDTFEIITDPPPPLMRGITPETAAYLEKLGRTLSVVQVGQAFIIPANKKQLSHRYFKANYTGERFLFTKILGNDGFVRAYRLPLDKKKK